MIVDRDKCIGCTLCKQDCIVSDIEMIDKKAHIRNLTCIKCGHCIAICPVKAVSCDDEEEYSMEEVIPYEKEDFTIDADKLMNFMKFRRSVRLFKKDEIEEEKIEKIIDAGRFTQTSTNMQDVSYTIVKDSIPELRRMTLGTLNAMADKMLGNEETPKHLLKYAHMWKRMYESFVENPDGHDQLFFKAPLLIIVKAQNEIDGGLASAKMELMIDALGLGTYFSGFFERAASMNPKIGEMIGLKEGEKIISCMVVGYPRVEYKRTVPRKPARVTRM